MMCCSKIKLSIIVIVLTISSFLVNADLEKEHHSRINELGVITVALLENDNRSVKNTHRAGELYNLNLTFLNQLGAYLGLEFEFISFDSISDVEEALLNDSVDIALSFSEDLLNNDTFLRTDPIMNVSVSYWVNNKAKVLPENELDWVCVEGSVYCEILEEKGVDDIIRVDSFSSAAKIVSKGGNTALIESYVSLAEYLNTTNDITGIIISPSWADDVYTNIISTRKNLNLINVLNNGIKFLGDGVSTRFNPYYASDMANRAYRRNSKGQNVVRYSFDDDSFPLLFRGKNGELSGYIFDVLELIESRTSLRFQYVPHRGDTSLLSMLENREIDIIPYSLIKEGSDDAVFTDSLVNFKYYPIKIKSKSSLNNEKPTGVLLSESKVKRGIKEEFFGIDSIVFTELKTLLKSLEDGYISRAYLREDIIDLVFLTQPTEQYEIDRDEFKSIESFMAVTKDLPLLVDVLNGVFKTWDSTELQKIKNSYDPFNVVYGYEEKYLYQIVLGFIMLFLVGGTLFFLVQKNLKLKIIIKDKDTTLFKLENRFLQTVITHLPSMVFIHDNNLEPYYGSCDEYKLGKCKGCIITSDNEFVSGPKRNILERVINDGITYNEVINISDCNLNIKNVDVVCKRIVVNDTIYALTVANDITEKTNRENELKTARAKAEQAISIREKFLASMSHELRTPIAGMVGLIEILESKVVDKDQLLFLENISSSANQLNLLVNDILDFSKIESNQLKLSPSKCDLLRQTGELIRNYTPLAQKKGLKLDYLFVPSEVRNISLDPLRYTQILNNILSNAIKFTDKGGISVKVKLEHSELTVCVADTGCGMTKEQLDRVFNPFVQADSSIARKYGGTGLGLAIVSELIEIMQGKLDIESIFGLGTKIIIKIPHQHLEDYNYFEDGVHIDISDDLLNTSIPEWVRIWSGRRPLIDRIDSNCDTMKKILITGNKELYCEGTYDGVVLISDISYGNTHFSNNLLVIGNAPIYPELIFDSITELIKFSSGKIIKNEPSFVKEREKLTGNILVAEDNIINQLLIKRQLDEFGLNYTVLSNGHLAYEKLVEGNERYDVVITDCHMPIMDGFELARKIRTDSVENSAIPIIGYTAEDSKNIRASAKKSGFDELLIKPYGIDNLYNILYSMLTSESTPDFVNVEWLNEYDNDELNEIVDTIITCFTNDIKMLVDDVNELDEFKRVVHRIKGGVSSIGIEFLSDYLKCIESKIVNDPDFNLKSEKEQLVSILNVYIRDIQSYIGDVI